MSDAHTNTNDAHTDTSGTPTETTGTHTHTTGTPKDTSGTPTDTTGTHTHTTGTPKDTSGTPTDTTGTHTHTTGTPAKRDGWPLYEVFVRGKRGLNHVHVGSLHAADDRMALTHARDLYTRRNEGVSIWVVRSEHITASTRDEKDPFFDPSADKVYRHPTFYDIPDDVPHI